MKSILLAHARRYPRMEPRDAVKLIYQSTFGGGHLIREEEACLRCLRQEYESTPQNGAPLLEDIGNGIFRVNLGALDAHGYDPAQLGRDFIRSSALVQGTTEDFRFRLALLSELTDAGGMPFSPDALSDYLTEYEQAGFPPVSHSEAYRDAYHPAYRVVDGRCLGEQYRLP